MSRRTNWDAAVPACGLAVLLGGEWIFIATDGLAKGFLCGPFRDQGAAVLDGAALACCLGIELLHGVAKRPMIEGATYPNE